MLLAEVARLEECHSRSAFEGCQAFGRSRRTGLDVGSIPTWPTNTFKGLARDRRALVISRRAERVTGRAKRSAETPADVFQESGNDEGRVVARTSILAPHGRAGAWNGIPPHGSRCCTFNSSQLLPISRIAALRMLRAPPRRHHAALGSRSPSPRFSTAMRHRNRRQPPFASDPLPT